MGLKIENINIISVENEQETNALFSFNVLFPEKNTKNENTLINQLQNSTIENLKHLTVSSLIIN